MSRLITIKGTSDSQWNVDRAGVIVAALISQGTASLNPSDTGNYTTDLEDGVTERFYLSATFAINYPDQNFPVAAGEVVYVRNSGSATLVQLWVDDMPAEKLT